MRMTLTILLAMAVGALPLHSFTAAEESWNESVRSQGTVSAVPVLSAFPSELTVGGLVSLANGNYAIQMGAFGRRANAEALSRKITEMSGLPVDIIEDAGLFKVFINSALRGEAPCLYIPVAFEGENGRSTSSDNETLTEAAEPETESQKGCCQAPEP